MILVSCAGVPTPAIPTATPVKTGLLGSKGKKGADGSIKIINSSGKDIDSLFISETGQDSWGNNYLLGAKLKEGAAIIISFKPDEDECTYDLSTYDLSTYDLKGIDQDGNEVLWQNVALCNIKTLNLHSQDGKNWISSQE
jgi:hypothetical protein